MENKEAIKVLKKLIGITRGETKEAIEAAIRVMVTVEEKEWAKEYMRNKVDK